MDEGLMFTFEEKKPGDLLQSRDWNKAMQAIVNLGANTLNRAGGNLTGPLTIEAALNVKGPVEAEKFIGDGSGLTGIQGGQWLDKPDGTGIYYSTGNVTIGATNRGATLQILNRNQDANGDTLILGPTSASNLRLGYHANYSWVQSHGNKPLAINSIGNNVGIGTADPKVKLQISGGSAAAQNQANSGYLIIGDPARTHLAFDDNKILAKASGVTAGTLRLQAEGGSTALGGDLKINGALQLSSGPAVKAIIPKGMARGSETDDALPTVSLVSGLIQETMKEILFSRWAITILPDSPIVVDPATPPRAAIEADKVSYAGAVWFRSPDTPPPNQSGWTNPLIRFYPPPATPYAGKIGIFGQPRTRPGYDGTLMVDCEVNQAGELRVSRFAESWLLGQGRIDLSAISYLFRPLKTG
jgi:hypothetical protein